VSRLATSSSARFGATSLPNSILRKISVRHLGQPADPNLIPAPNRRVTPRAWSKKTRLRSGYPVKEGAKKTNVMIHTPHRDKHRGTLRTMDVLAEHKFDPARCVMDHNTEETVREMLERGYFAGFSIYPHTKMGNERLTEIVRHYGPERIIADSVCDWGVSAPLAVPKTAASMAERGLSAQAIRAVTYDNALAVYGLSGAMKQSDWLDPAPIDQRTLFQGNSVLRGGQTPRIESSRDFRDLRIS